MRRRRSPLTHSDRSKNRIDRNNNDNSGNSHSIDRSNSGHSNNSGRSNNTHLERRRPHDKKSSRRKKARPPPRVEDRLVVRVDDRVISVRVVVADRGRSHRKNPRTRGVASR